MIEIFVVGFLALTNIALLVFVWLQSKETRKMNEKVFNTLISRNATELRDLELTAKVAEIKPQPEPDLIPISDLTDEEFEKKVLDRELN